MKIDLIMCEALIQARCPACGAAHASEFTWGTRHYWQSRAWLGEQGAVRRRRGNAQDGALARQAGTVFKPGKFTAHSGWFH